MCNCNMCKWGRREISKKEYLKWLLAEKEKELAKKDTSEFDECSFEECNDMLWEADHSRTIYISGPITTNKEHYQECFEAAKEFLQSKGYDVIDPSTDDYTEAVKEAGIEDIWSPEAWLWYLQRDMTVVSNCDGIYMLNNWEQSKGGIVEKIVAEKFKLPIYFESKKEEVPDYTESEMWYLYH